MTEAELDLEETRKKYCITHVRHSDLGEAVTNSLMEQLNDEGNFLETMFPLLQEDVDASTPFKITRRHCVGGNHFETRIGGVEVSDVLSMRLQALYIHNNPFSLLTNFYLDDFLRRAFLLVYRYTYIDPGFRRQGFLAPQYFEGIEDAFKRKINLEGFASALNTTVPKYCSLFFDVERYFGSIGSFFDLQDLGKNYLVQVSPPRIGKITLQAVEHSIKLIDKTMAPDKPAYHIILLTPASWFDITRLLDASKYLVWKYDPGKGEKIGYLDVTSNKPSLYPKPRISVLSNSSDIYFSRKLHKLFS